MSDCLFLGDSNLARSDSMHDHDFTTCFSFGLNSTCPLYAKSTVECGGTIESQTEEDDRAQCMATLGAWNDDTQDLCD